MYVCGQKMNDDAKKGAASDDRRIKRTKTQIQNTRQSNDVVRMESHGKMKINETNQWMICGTNGGTCRKNRNER